tara:strand:- start:2967 stop:3524 length:558 start_codon:yes stop_codon:yes gene_type:complete
MTKTKIILYGKLVKLIGQKVFYAKLNTVGQVFSFLKANYPQLQDTFLKTNYCIKVGEKYINDKNINYPLSDQTLRLVPVAEGAFIGAVLGFVFTTVVPAAAKVYAVNTVSNLLKPTPKPPNINNPNTTKAQKDKSISGSFNGITNTVNAGTAIPLLYGETITGSIVISSSVDTVQFSGKGKEEYN